MFSKAALTPSRLFFFLLACLLRLIFLCFYFIFCLYSLSPPPSTRLLFSHHPLPLICRYGSVHLRFLCCTNRSSAGLNASSKWNKSEPPLEEQLVPAWCFLADFSVDLQLPNKCWEIKKKKKSPHSGSSLFGIRISGELGCCASARFHPGVTSFFLSPSSPPVDDVPPYFKMEPPQTQVHLERNRLVLTCMAEGSWPLEFKWLYNGSELTRFSLEYR